MTITSLRELYLSKTVKQQATEDLTINFLNLQQAWLRLDLIVKNHKIDPGLEFAFSDLLGHFYAAESIFLEVLDKKETNSLKVFQSVKASQQVLTDLAGLIAKLAITGVKVGSLEEALALNSGKIYREEVAKGLRL